jgi:hypothetical protein
VKGTRKKKSLSEGVFERVRARTRRISGPTPIRMLAVHALGDLQPGVSQVLVMELAEVVEPIPQTLFDGEACGARGGMCSFAAGCGLFARGIGGAGCGRFCAQRSLSRTYV